MPRIEGEIIICSLGASAEVSYTTWIMWRIIVCMPLWLFIDDLSMLWFDLINWIVELNWCWSFDFVFCKMKIMLCVILISCDFFFTTLKIVDFDFVVWTRIFNWQVCNFLWQFVGKLSVQIFWKNKTTPSLHSLMVLKVRSKRWKFRKLHLCWHACQ